MSDSPITVAERGVALRLEGVRRVFDNQLVVIDDFNLSIDAGEFLASTRALGMWKVHAAAHDRRAVAILTPAVSSPILMTFQTAFVFQDAHLLPWRSVLDNAALPLELMGVGREERYAKTRAVLRTSRVGGRRGRYPAQLSGGMRMRVSLARALVTEPRLLLMDEPFAALDEITRFHLEVQLRELWSSRGMTVIFVTHSISEAAFLANRAIVLARRRGEIKLDRKLELPRSAPMICGPIRELGREMQAAVGAMEEE